MVYQPKNPQGYKNLLTWKQAGEIYHKTKDFTRDHLDTLRDRRLIAHMNDSARSIQRNIEEGYKRATTKEYVEFLGFSRGSLEELKGDFEELKREWKEQIRWKTLLT
jgi:four helix bundle protein